MTTTNEFNELVQKLFSQEETKKLCRIVFDLVKTGNSSLLQSMINAESMQIILACLSENTDMTNIINTAIDPNTMNGIKNALLKTEIAKENTRKD